MLQPMWVSIKMKRYKVDMDFKKTRAGHDVVAEKILKKELGYYYDNYLVDFDPQSILLGCGWVRADYEHVQGIYQKIPTNFVLAILRGSYSGGNFAMKQKFIDAINQYYVSIYPYQWGKDVDLFLEYLSTNRVLQQEMNERGIR